LKSDEIKTNLSEKLLEVRKHLEESKRLPIDL